MQLAGSTDRCQLRKEYQVGGFAAPEPCTNCPDFMEKIVFNNVETLLRELHPHSRDAFRGLTEDLKRAYEQRQTSTYFRPLEGLRSPLKQQVLFEQRPVVTHVGPWLSPHQYGLAVDFVAVRNGAAVLAGTANKLEWSWNDEHDWRCLAQCAQNRGLMNDIKWDKPHVESPLWRTLLPLIKGKADLRTVEKA